MRNKTKFKDPIIKFPSFYTDDQVADEIEKVIPEIDSSMRGKWSRTKGHSFEREIAQRLRKLFPGSRRHLEYHVGDANGIDIDNVGQLRIQCKRGKRYAALTAIEEIQLDPRTGGVPVLITQADRKEILVALPFGAFLNLLKDAGHGEKKNVE